MQQHQTIGIDAKRRRISRRERFLGALPRLRSPEEERREDQRREFARTQVDGSRERFPYLFQRAP